MKKGIFKPHQTPQIRTRPFEFTVPDKDPFYTGPKPETTTKSGHKLGR